MKTLKWVVVWGALMSGRLTAGPVYQINFTGTLTSGTLADLNLVTNTLDTVADLTGMQVSGWMRFDLGVAPAPSVSTNGVFTTSSIQSDNGPFFASEHLVLGAIPLAANFLPVPAVFDLPPIPPFPAGGTVTQSADRQSLGVTSGPPGFAQDLIGGMQYAYARDTAQFHSSNLVSLFGLVNSPGQFFPIPTPGAFPDSWAVANPGGNAIFTFFELTQDKTIADAAHHFGLSTDYEASGNLTLDSASGGFVAPEPGTFPLVASLVALFALGSGRRRSTGPLHRPPGAGATHTPRPAGCRQ